MGDVRAGGAYVEIGYKDQGFLSGIATAGMGLLDFASKISMVYVAVKDMAIGFANAVADIVLETTKIGSAAVDAAAKSGLTAEQVQSLGYVAKQSGASLEALTGAIKFMQRGLVDAAETGTGPMSDALQRMGMDVKGLINLDPQSQFYAIADGISKIQDPAVRTKIAMDMFSRTGEDMIPVLSGGSAEIKRMQARAYELGGVISESGSKRFKKFGDAIADIGVAFQGVKNRIADAFLPVLEGIVPQVISVFRTLQEWVTAHTVEIGQGLATAWEFVKGVMITVWGVAKEIYSAISDFITSVTFSRTPLEAMKKIFDSILFVVQAISKGIEYALKIARTLYAISPIGLVANAIGGKGPGTALNEIWNPPQKTGSIATPSATFPAIASAPASGVPELTAAIRENTEQLRKSRNNEVPSGGFRQSAATTHDVVTRGRAGAARAAKPRG